MKHLPNYVGLVFLIVRQSYATFQTFVVNGYVKEMVKITKQI